MEVGQCANKVLFVISLHPQVSRLIMQILSTVCRREDFCAAARGIFTWEKHDTKLNGRDAGKMQVPSVVHRTAQTSRSQL